MKLRIVFFNALLFLGQLKLLIIKAKLLIGVPVVYDGEQWFNVLISESSSLLWGDLVQLLKNKLWNSERKIFMEYD